MDRQRNLVDAVFSQKLKDNIRVAATWARADAILAMLFTAWLVITNLARGGFLQLFVMLALGGVSIVKCVYLFNFGNRTKKGIDNIDQNELEEGLNSLRLFMKIWVRILIGVAVLFGLGFLFTAL
ncbi:MAG TPA: hypothetical protein VHB48_05535 [Chitinophagaceae bacterium]|nr:hypothetical protein [Chitinophagaceae bacterium]